jgi:predicted kinase
MSQTLFLMLGYPGSGKTTTAKALCQLTGAEHILADVERAKHFAQPTHSREESHALYTELNGQAATLLRQGKSVVFDANFNTFRARQNIRQVATFYGAQTVIVWVQTPKDVAFTRATQANDQRIFQVTEADFWRMAKNLQPPQKGELSIEVDGTEPVTPVLLRQKLATLK